MCPCARSADDLACPLATAGGAAGLRAALEADPASSLGPEEEPHLYMATVVVLHDTLLALHHALEPSAPSATPWAAYLASLPPAFEDLPFSFSTHRPAGAPRLWTRLGDVAAIAEAQARQTEGFVGGGSYSFRAFLRSRGPTALSSSSAQREEHRTLLPFILRAVRRLPHGAAALAAVDRLEAAPGADTLVAQLAAWAWAVARTRSIDLPPSALPGGASVVAGLSRKAAVLVPFIDMANHADRDVATARLVTDVSAGTVALLATRPLAAGTQVSAHSAPRRPVEAPAFFWVRLR